MKGKLEKLGPIGTIIVAAACPVCFPKLALLGALFGMGALTQFEVLFFYAAQLIVILVLIGNMVAYKRHRNMKILILVAISSVLFFVSLYVLVSEYLSYAAMSGLVVSAVWLVFENRKEAVCKRGSS